MRLKKRVYKRTKHRFRMWNRNQKGMFFGKRTYQIHDRCRIDQLAGRHQFLRIRTVRNNQDRSKEKIYKWLGRLMKHNTSLLLFLTTQPGYVKMYRTKRPRYYRGLPHTIEGYQMQLDFEERQKLIDRDNIEAMNAMYQRIQALEHTLDAVLLETNGGDISFEVTVATLPNDTINKAKEVLKDVAWNPWNDKPTNYPSIKSQVTKPTDGSDLQLTVINATVVIVDDKS